MLKNEWFEVLELVALFLLKTGTFGAKNWKEISVDAIFCLFFFRSFSKRRGQIHSNFDYWKFFNPTAHSA